MKIALFTEVYPPLINGVSTHVKTLKNGLEKLGHKVLVVTALAKIKKHFIKDGILYCPGISWDRIYDFGIAKPISPVRFKYIKQFNPDIIHIHTEFGVGFSGITAAKLLKIPCVYTMHTMYDDYIHYVASKKFIGIAKKVAHFYGRQIAKRADIIVGPSVKIKEFLEKFNLKKEIEIVPNCVETDLFNPLSVEKEKVLNLKRKLFLNDEDFVGCFCGRIGKEKNIQLLIQNWAEVVKEDLNKNKKLLIFGEGPKRQELEKLVEKLNISDNVKFLGKIEHKDLPPYYCLCDFYVTASLSEVHSISTLEAMASGLYVFHIFDEKNKSQILEGVNGSIYSSAKEMKDLILKYERLNIEERKTVRERVRQSVLENGELQLGERIIRIYEKILKNKKNRHFLKKAKLRLK